MNGSQRVLYLALIAIGCGITVRFGIYWFAPERVPHDSHGSVSVLGLVLFVLLSFTLWQRHLVEMLVWWVCRRIRGIRAAPVPQDGLRVAFITTFVPGAEPLEMLARTLGAMTDAQYPHDTWVLDEGGTEATRTLAESLGVKYFSRFGHPHLNTDGGTFARKTKGGNHNAWYAEFADDYDIVAEIDTDFIAAPNFLTETLGHFADPTVAYVGTPQVYGNVDSSLIARGAAQQTYLFYGAIMRGFGDRGMALLIGANHVIRVQALRDIGYYVAHLTEDLATGMTLHSRRWRSVYVPRVLAVGEGPTTWSGYFNQQYRWAFGCLDILFCRTPGLARTMRLKTALMYPMLQTFYFNGLAMIASVCLLFTYFVSGQPAAQIDLRELILAYGPLLIWRQMLTFYLQSYNVRPQKESGFLFAGRLLTVAAMPIYFLALAGVIRRRRMTFTVTPKGKAAKAGESLHTFRPHFAVALVSIAGLIVGFSSHHRAWVMEGWATVTVVSFLAIPWSAQVWTLGRRVKGRLGARVIGAASAHPAIAHPVETMVDAMAIETP